MFGRLTIVGLATVLSLSLSACGTVEDVFERGDTGASARSSSGKKISKQGVGGLRPRENVKKRDDYRTAATQSTTQERRADSAAAPQTQAATLAPVRPSNTPAGLTIASTQENLQAVVSRAAISQQQFSKIQNRHLRNIAQYEIAQTALVSQLDAGAVAGDPVLTGQWNTTQSALNQVTSDLNGLSAASASLKSEQANLAQLKEQLPSDSAIASEDAKQLGVLKANIAETESSISALLSRIAPLVDEKERFISKAQNDLRQLEPTVRGN